MSGTSKCIVCTEAVPLQDVQNHMKKYHPYFGSSQPDETDVVHSDSENDDYSEPDVDREVETNYEDDKSETKESDLESDVGANEETNGKDASSIDRKSEIDNSDFGNNVEETNDKTTSSSNQKSVKFQNVSYKEEWIVNVSHKGKQLPKSDAQNVTVKNGDQSKKLQTKFCTAKLHNKSRKFPCDLCSFKFKYRSNLNRHKRNVHKVNIGKKQEDSENATDKNVDHSASLPPKLYGCEICKAKFSSQNNFMRHKNLHNMSRKYPCDLCSFRFKTGSDLKKHKRNVHKLDVTTNESLTTQVKEQKAASDKENKKTGESESKKFRCKICSLSYEVSSSLTRHQKLKHKNKKSSSCNESISSLSDNESLSVRKNCNEKENNEKKERSNEKEHDSDKVVHYTCDICTLIFLSEDFLKRHKSRAHSNKIPVPVSLEPLPPVAKTNDIVNSCDINDFDYKANLSRKNLRIDVKNIFAGKSTSFIELIKKKYLTEEDTNNDDSDGTETDEAPTSEFSVFNAVDEVNDKHSDQSSGVVTLRSQQMQSTKGVDLKMTKDMENKLAELGISNKIPATDEICEEYNELMSDLRILHEIQNSLHQCMTEMAALNTEYSSIVPNKSLEIPQQWETEPIGIKLSCKTCGKSFNLLKALIKHEKLHNPSRKYSCDLCGYRYINKSHLKEHKIRYCRFKVTKNSRNNDLLTNDETSKSPSKNCSVNQSRQFACDLCSHTYNNETALMRHQGFHDKTRKYSCEKCSFRFIANSHLKRHRQKYCSYRGVSSTPTEADPQSSTPTKVQSYLKHPPPEPEEPKQQSYILSRLFSGGHMNDDKAKNVIWKNKVDSKDCDQPSSEVSLRSQQMKKLIGVDLKMTKDMENKLSELGIGRKISATDEICLEYNELIADLTNFHKMKNSLHQCMNEITALNSEYSAIVPNKSLEIPQQLKDFQLSITNQNDPQDVKNNQDATQLKQFTCDTCSLSFTKSDSLLTHKKMHDPSRPIPCNLCSYRFRFPSDLKRHIKSFHNGNKPKESPTLIYNGKRKLSEIYNNTDDSIEEENEALLKNKKERIDICNVMTNESVRASGIVTVNKDTKLSGTYNDTEDNVEVEDKPEFHVKKVRVDVCNVRKERLLKERNLVKNIETNDKTNKIKNEEHERITEHVESNDNMIVLNKRLSSYQNKSVEHLSTSEAAMIKFFSHEKDDLTTNKEDKTPEQRYFCSDCNSSFLTEYRLLAHKISRHNYTAKNVCDVCGSSFLILNDLINHKSIVHNLKNTGNNMQTSEKVYNIKNVVVGHNMQTNEKIHHNIMVTSSNMQTNEKFGGYGRSVIISNNHPFKCEECNKELKSGNLYYAHKRLHDPTRKNPCDICGLRYIKKSDLTRHKEAVHKVKINSLQADKSNVLQFPNQQRSKDSNKLPPSEPEIIEVEEENQTISSSERITNHSISPYGVTQANVVILPQIFQASAPVVPQQSNVPIVQPAYQNIVFYQQQEQVPQVPQIGKSPRLILPKNLHITDVRSELLEQLMGDMTQQQAVNPTQNMNLPPKETTPQQLLVNKHQSNTQATPSNVVNNQANQILDLTGTNIRYFQCDLCNMAYRNKSSLNRHKKMHHRTEGGGTANVDKVNEQISEQVTSAQASTTMDIEINICSICDTAVPGRRNLIEHFKSVHGADTNFLFKCEICCIVFTSRESMMKHSREGHQVNNVYCCDICNKTFLLIDSLNHHMLEEHKTTAKSGSQQDHSSKSITKNSFQCDICYKEFKLKQSLTRHKKREHLSNMYVGLTDIETNEGMAEGDYFTEYVPCESEDLYYQGYEEDNIESFDPLDTTNVSQFVTTGSRVNFDDYEI